MPPQKSQSKSPPPAATPSPWPVWLLAAALAAGILALYWPATNCDFTNCDDNVYVTENPRVQMGITWDNIRWAFANTVSANWHPLTTLSHMLDCQIYGLAPWGHHLTGIVLHAINTALVLLVLHRFTGRLWPSAMVAALFGCHPLHVESVAWVAERKDVLSCCFWLLTMWAYVNYARPGGAEKMPSRQTRSRRLWYALALIFLALGLLSKAMLVTLPFALLLLDYWPLGRFQPVADEVTSRSRRVRALIIEKLPFLALAIAASAVTMAVQDQGGAVNSFDRFPLDVRIGNALISYCRYLGKFFWPADLAVFYPHPGAWPVGDVFLAALFLVAVSAVCLAVRARYPFALVGWLWFLGTLVPVIGLVQVGEQAMADRYMYIPSLGLLILVVWGALACSRRGDESLCPSEPPAKALLTSCATKALGSRRGNESFSPSESPGKALLTSCATSPLLAMAGAAVLLACCVLTRQQIGYWQNSETLYKHAIAVTKDNAFAINNLGNDLLWRGKTDEALTYLQEGVRFRPGVAECHNNLANALLAERRVDDAIRESEEAIRLKPGLGRAHLVLGNALFDKGQKAAALAEYEQSVRLDPDYVVGYINFGAALLNAGRLDEAISELETALRLKPDSEDAEYNLGAAFLQKGQIPEAIDHFQKALKLKPDDADAQRDLAKAMALTGTKN